MERKPFQRSRANRAWLLGLCGLGACALSARAQYDPDWVRNFRLGALTGFNIKTDFKITGASLGVSGGGNGRYDDGYVIPDPNNTSDNFTSNWGYNSESQFDAGAQTLTLHRTTGFTPDEAFSKSAEADMEVGFEMEYGGYPWRWTRSRLGFTFGFGYLPITSSQKVSLEGSSRRISDVFNTHSPVIPPAPYQGNAGGDGFNLDSGVVSSTEENLDNAILEGKETLDVTLFAFRLGPSLFLDLHPSIGLTLGAGPALGLITGDYEFDETITTGGTPSRSHGSFGDTEVVYGGYVNVTITYHATLNGDFYLGAQYMPLTSAEFSDGGRSARLDLSGAIYVSAGINWPF